jgi:type IV pilus assembly protein PilP
MKLTIRAIALVTPALFVAACGESNADLREFVRNSEKQVPRTIEALPQVKPFEPFAYEGFDIPDPFRPRKLSTAQNAGGQAPDQTRRKEPLESYPLEQLKMVGTIVQKGVTYGLVRADKTLYQVNKGKYMGQNFGRIMSITDTEIKLKEIVQDTAGDWTDRESILPLLEGTGGKP